MTRKKKDKTSKDLILLVDDQPANLKVIANIPAARVQSRLCKHRHPCP